MKTDKELMEIIQRTEKIERGLRNVYQNKPESKNHPMCQDLDWAVGAIRKLLFRLERGLA